MKSKSSRVFISNLGAHDYTKVKKYGELVPITEGQVNIFHTDRLIANIKEKLLAENATREDFLLLSGNALVSSLVLHEWLKKFGKARLLIYNAVSRDYELRDIFD